MDAMWWFGVAVVVALPALLAVVSCRRSSWRSMWRAIPPFAVGIAWCLAVPDLAFLGLAFFLPTIMVTNFLTIWCNYLRRPSELVLDAPPDVLPPAATDAAADLVAADFSPLAELHSRRGSAERAFALADRSRPVLAVVTYHPRNRLSAAVSFLTPLHGGRLETCEIGIASSPYHLAQVFPGSTVEERRSHHHDALAFAVGRGLLPAGDAAQGLLQTYDEATRFVRQQYADRGVRWVATVWWRIVRQRWVNQGPIALQPDTDAKVANIRAAADSPTWR